MRLLPTHSTTFIAFIACFTTALSGCVGAPPTIMDPLVWHSALAVYDADRASPLRQGTNATFDRLVVEILPPVEALYRNASIGFAIPIEIVRIDRERDFAYENAQRYLVDAQGTVVSLQHRCTDRYGSGGEYRGCMEQSDMIWIAAGSTGPFAIAPRLANDGARVPILVVYDELLVHAERPMRADTEVIAIDPDHRNAWHPYAAGRFHYSGTEVLPFQMHSPEGTVWTRSAFDRGTHFSVPSHIVQLPNATVGGPGELFPGSNQDLQGNGWTYDQALEALRTNETFRAHEAEGCLHSIQPGGLGSVSETVTEDQHELDRVDQARITIRLPEQVAQWTVSFARTLVVEGTRIDVQYEPLFRPAKEGPCPAEQFRSSLVYFPDAIDSRDFLRLRLDTPPQRTMYERASDHTASVHRFEALAYGFGYAPETSSGFFHMIHFDPVGDSYDAASMPGDAWNNMTEWFRSLHEDHR